MLSFLFAGLLIRHSVGLETRLRGRYRSVRVRAINLRGCIWRSSPGPVQFPTLLANSKHLIPSFSRSNAVYICQPNLRRPNNQQRRNAYRQRRNIKNDRRTNHSSSNMPTRRCPHHHTRRRLWNHPEYTCQIVQERNASQSDGPRPELTGSTYPRKFFRWRQAKRGNLSAGAWGRSHRKENLQLSCPQIRRARAAHRM